MSAHMQARADDFAEQRARKQEQQAQLTIRILILVTQGITFADIASRLRCSKASVRRVVASERSLRSASGA